VANFGTWLVDEANRTITYHHDGALFLNFEGVGVKETISLSGDEMKLVGEFDQTVWRQIEK
jgi:hypothetical protein